MSTKDRVDGALGDLAGAMGILPHWRDLAGVEQTAGPDTQRALLAAMGVPVAGEAEIRESLEAHRAREAARRIPEEIVVTAGTVTRIPLERTADWRIALESGGMLEGRDEREIAPALPVGLHRLSVGDDVCLVIAAPERAPAVVDLAGRGKAWGLSAALYGLRSQRNLGVGDYRDLADAAVRMARLGADFIGINPVHARGTANDGFSPYSPTCRTALEPGHIAPDAVPGFESSAEVRRLLERRSAALETEKAGDLLDYEAHEQRRREALDALFRATVEADGSAAADLAAWRKGPGRALEWFAVFEAIACDHGPDWRAWPEALRVTGSPNVRRFAFENERSVRYHAWLQRLAHRQIAEAQTAAKGAGMAFGLYLDLAAGVRPGGADTWASPDCFAEGVSLGAPPDAFSPDGQTWNLAPFSPPGLRAAGYEPFVRMLRAAMAHAAIVRIDHVLGLDRGFWVPESGAPGGYVRYPLEPLLALVRIEAARAGCIVVGEDLGSVPPGLRRRLASAGLLGCAVMQFETGEDGLRPPRHYRPASLASAGTHDTPTLKGWWCGRDIELRHGLGRTTARERTAALAARAAERRALCRLLVEEGHAPSDLDPATPPREADDATVVAVHALLAGAGSSLLAVQLDDVLGLVEQQNLPGTIDEHPNWRRRYPVAVEALAGDPGLAAVARVVGSRDGTVRDRTRSSRGTVETPLEPEQRCARPRPEHPERHSREGGNPPAFADDVCRSTGRVDGRRPSRAYGARRIGCGDLTMHEPSTLPDAAALRRSIEYHLRYSAGKTPAAATLTDWRLAVSRAVRDLVIAPWFETTQRVYAEDRKRVCYLSMEFLIGRLLEDAVANLGLDERLRDIVEGFGADYGALLTDEPDAALGNGGLGRLAACFLDSMSTVGLAAYGYGIRYAHGLFRQSFEDGWQVEEAEDWLRHGHPWEFERPEASFPVRFGGCVRTDGTRTTWTPAETVLAVAYDTPVPGWRGRWCNTLRLWSARSVRAFDLEPFNRGDWMGAAAPAVLAETISRVLYPDDTTERGRELRLKQEYFFTAASLADILRRFLAHHDDVARLPRAVAVQLNDTHPAIAFPELIRLLVDDHGQAFDDAFEIARGCLHYTNHTLLPEALERWPVDLMRRLLPRHMELIERIDAHHAGTVRRPAGVKVIDGGEVRMGDLAFIGARRVNGVSALHTELMKQTVFRDLHALHPERIVNRTNGVTHRRWLHNCNPALRDLLTETIGEAWVADLEGLQALVPLADDPGFRARFAEAKQRNKRRLADWLARNAGVTVDPRAMFDVHIKRIHEYKRQLMNILHAAALWNEVRRDPDADRAPRVKIIAGKAAPGYAMAKLVIKLINDIGATINADPVMAGRLQVVYPPDYNVSMAEVLIPAADLSEQISTAGMEASGTGNMKLAMNGALTVGTLDGANIEIGEAVGRENIFVFGLSAGEVAATRAAGHRPEQCIAADPVLAEVLEQIASGLFSPDDPHRYAALVDNLRRHDWFMVTADFAAYLEIQRRIDAAWGERDDWNRRAVLNTARMGRFSSDRTIRGYARDIWDAVPAF